jgi:hypothetical protein
VGRQHFELEERQQRGAYLTLDAQRVLTPLGRQQAVATGDRLAALLQPALTTAGREGDVRVHSSTLSRAKETADLIASRLPARVVRLPPDPLLSEGNPAPDVPDCWFADGPSIHVEGARVEAGFRTLFHRAVPRKPPVPAAAPPPPPAAAPGAAAAVAPPAAAPATSASLAVEANGPWEDRQRHEYDIVVHRDPPPTPISPRPRLASPQFTTGSPRPPTICRCAT